MKSYDNKPTGFKTLISVIRSNVQSFEYKKVNDIRMQAYDD